MQADASPSLLRDWIAYAARRDPRKPWIVSVDSGRSVSYGRLQETTGRIAALLRQQDIKPNERIALLSNNSIEHLMTYLGVLAYGATICTVHVEMNRNQLDNIFERLKPSLVLCQDGIEPGDLLATVSAPQLALGGLDDPRPDTFFGSAARLAPSEVGTGAEADDDAVIVFTSGTSAQPKGVV